MSLMIEMLVVAAFVLSCIVLVFGSIIVMFGSIAGGSADETLLGRHRNLRVAVGALLVPVIAGFPVVLHDNPKAFPVSFVFSGIAMLMLVRLWFGEKAKWAVWLAGATVAVLLAWSVWQGHA